jgi:hypothetical protein
MLTYSVTEGFWMNIVKSTGWFYQTLKRSLAIGGGAQYQSSASNQPDQPRT